VRSSQELSKAIKETLKLKGKSAREMLLACEMNKDTLNTMDKGSMLLADRLCRIADYLDVSTDYLLGRTDKPEINK